MRIIVRIETEADYEQITNFHTIAFVFGRNGEARLIEKL
jgi:predicted N-acetyltransferase YhbS